MSVEITIHQRRLFKKQLPLQVLTGSKLRYGTFDGMRIQPSGLPQDDEDVIILYHPKHIGRGFSADWHSGIRDEITLCLPVPSTTQEIDAFYDAVSRVCAHWDAEWFEQDGESVSVLQIGEQRIAMADFHLRALNELCTDEGETTLPCTFFPLVLGASEKAMLREAHSLRPFCDYLHEKQAADVYYPMPQFFHEDGSLCGVFVIPSDTDCVLPHTPEPPLLSEIQNGEIAHWYVTFYPIGGNTITGKLKYEDFLHEIHFDELNYFDAAHHILPGMSPERQQQLSELLGIN